MQGLPFQLPAIGQTTPFGPSLLGPVISTSTSPGPRSLQLPTTGAQPLVGIQLPVIGQGQGLPTLGEIHTRSLQFQLPGIGQVPQLPIAGETQAGSPQFQPTRIFSQLPSLGQPPQLPTRLPILGETQVAHQQVQPLPVSEMIRRLYHMYNSDQISIQMEDMMRPYLQQALNIATGPTQVTGPPVASFLHNKFPVYYPAVTFLHHH